MHSCSDVISHVCFYSHYHQDMVGHSNIAFNANARMALPLQAVIDYNTFE